MEHDELRRRASRYREIARRVTDPAAIKALQELAEEYEARANDTQAAHPEPQPPQSSPSRTRPIPAHRAEDGQKD
jgi:hypothetical protein